MPNLAVSLMSRRRKSGIPRSGSAGSITVTTVAQAISTRNSDP
jgi:hypothetical protein